jgi:hypothetical protein
MPKTRERTGSEVFDAVREDSKVYVALDDAIKAMILYGPDHVSLEHLKSVIHSRILAAADEQIEEEGMDGECA